MIITELAAFELPEYHGAFGAFVRRATDSLIIEKDPVLKRLQTSPTPQVPIVRNTMESGQIVENHPILVEMPFTIILADAVSGQIDSLLLAIDDAAEVGIGTIMPRFFEYLGRICDATGNTVRTDGQPPNHDLILDMFDRMEFDFDEQGTPLMPTLVVHPTMAETLSKIPPPSEEQKQRFRTIMERKTREFNDRRRTRKLS